MHGLPTLQYLNDAACGEGSDVAKAIIAGTHDEAAYQVEQTKTRATTNAEEKLSPTTVAPDVQVFHYQGGYVVRAKTAKGHEFLREQEFMALTLRGIRLNDEQRSQLVQLRGQAGITIG